MSAQTITIPWPAKELSPNARIHWAAKAKAVKGYRLACAWYAAEQRITRMDARKINARITFHPPSNRRMDIDNMLSRAKAGIDAVSDVIGVDDSKWELSLVRGEPRPKQGEIVMVLVAA